MNASRNNPAFQHVVSAAGHPVALAAMSLLLLNATVLQPRWPSWFTGKIGDAAWLVFGPLLVAAVVAWLVPARWAGQPRSVGWLAAGLCGAALVLVKTVPAANAGAVRLFQTLMGYPLKLALDPTDVIALPALAIFGWLWARPPVAASRRQLPGIAALGLAALAVMADAAAPKDLGITCIGETNNSLLAFQERNYHGEFGGDHHEVVVFQSGDGGLTWQQAASEMYDPANPPTPAPDGSNAPLLQFGQCTTHSGAWQLPDPSTQQVLYAFIGGQGIYRSDDAGQTLRKETDLAEASVLDARFESATGNLVAAVGPQGVMVRPPDGKWKTVTPGRTTNP